MRRRAFLASAGTTVAATAGCVGFQGDDGRGGAGDGVVTVATYESLVDGNDPVGPWLKERFEEEHDAEVAFRVPESGVNQYIQRARQGADIEADI
jgi:thiamine transport system substrate-binding protein